MAVRVVTNDSIPQPENISDAEIFAEDLRVSSSVNPDFFPALCSEGILPSSAVFRDRSHQCFRPPPPPAGLCVPAAKRGASISDLLSWQRPHLFYDSRILPNH